MTTQHLSDTIIQQYALEGPSFDAAVQEHMLGCENCRAKANNYQLLFSDITKIPKPVFEFDLPGLVLEKLPAKAQGFSWVYFSISILLLAFIGIAAYIFRDYLLNIFRSISLALLCLIAVPALIILIFHGIDVYKTYQRKMNSLNFY